jgi:hypothetical protein
MVDAILTPDVPVVNAGSLYVSNLQLVYVDTTHLNILPGAARDYTNTNDIILNSQITIDIQKSGVNGIDKGTTDFASTYAVYLIGDSRGYKPTAGIISLNLTAPQLPADYDMSRRIGWIVTDISVPLKMLKFYQYGTDATRSYYYDIGINGLNQIILGGNDTTYTEVTLTPIVPPINTQSFCRIQYAQSAPGNSCQFLQFGASDSLGNISISSGAAVTSWQTVEIPSSLDGGTSAFKYRVGTGDNVNVYLFGYRDYL